MHANAWAVLLRHIPVEQHGRLMLVTGSGVEIALQSILRVDHEFVAFKGRIAGSQDQGRLFFLPFENIDYINFNYVVKDEEYQAMFGTLTVPAASGTGPTALVPAATEEQVPEAPANGIAQEATAEPEAEAAPEPQPAITRNSTSRSGATIKSAVLERFRARSNPPTLAGQTAPDGPAREG